MGMWKCQNERAYSEADVSHTHTVYWVCGNGDENRNLKEHKERETKRAKKGYINLVWLIIVYISLPMHTVACSSTDRPKICSLFLIRFMIFVFCFSIPIASIQLFLYPTHFVLLLPPSTQINGSRIFQHHINSIDHPKYTLVKLLSNKCFSFYEMGRTCVSTFFGLQPVPIHNKIKSKYIEIKIEIMIATEERINRNIQTKWNTHAQPEKKDPPKPTTTTMTIRAVARRKRKKTVELCIFKLYFLVHFFYVYRRP